MIIRTILLSVLWSFLTVLSPVHDSLRPAFADETAKEAPSSKLSSKKNQFNSSARVQKVPFSVLLSKEPPQRIAGFLFWDPSNFKNCQKQRPLSRLLKCIKDRWLKNRTLQVLVHGFTYNHTYWDPPKKKLPNFSYARFMAQQGYPVLALDLLGTGESSIPDGFALNITESVSSLAQVLTSARALSNPLGRDFKRIVLVGHSVGSAIAVITAGSSPGITDFLVSTGWSFSPHVVPLNQDIIDASRVTPYIRFPDPVREELFYFTPSARQSVIDFDNRVLADQFPSGVLAEGLPLLTALALGEPLPDQFIFPINNVNIPVLVQLGRYDAITLPPMPEVEAQLYASSPDVSVEILERMGHSFNLHNNRLKSWTGINHWIEERLEKQQKPKG